VGKTELILKLAREHFDTCTYINLRDHGVADKFDELVLYHYEKLGTKRAEETSPVWEAVFKAFDESYTNEPTRLVFLDEIQESVAAYNGIRNIRRSLKSKLAVSGSYLGIAQPELGYRISTGDSISFELSSMSFREFLKANGVWDEYDKVNTFDWSVMTEAEQAICERVRELYRIYCQIGGYPDVVDEWVATNDTEVCFMMTERLLDRLYRESSTYFGELVGGSLWSHTLRQVAAHMVTKSGDLDITIAKETFRSDNSKGFEVRRKDKINALKWLEECRIVGMAHIHEDLGNVTAPSNKSLFYFRDMGLMMQLCRGLTSVLTSDTSGMVAENFVYLHLRDVAGNQFIDKNVWSYKGVQGQIDFIMHNNWGYRFGIEVKHGSGNTKSGDKALSDGKIDYLIRVQDTYGSISENQATIPIFMLDKLNLILDDERLRKH